MARLEATFPEDLFDGLLNMDTENLCREMVDSASTIMVEEMKRELRRVIQHPGESELVDSIQANAAKVVDDHLVMSFTAPYGTSKNYYYRYGGRRGRKHQVTNALKAIWLNYGRIGQPARPFLGPAIRYASPLVIKKMQQTYDQLTGGRNGSE